MNELPKETFRRNMIAIAQLAQEMAPVLSSVAFAGEIHGEPTTLENVVLVVNPHRGEVGLWNVNSLWERASEIFRGLESDSIRKAQEIVNLDAEIAKRRDILGMLQGHMPKPNGFDVN